MASKSTRRVATAEPDPFTPAEFAAWRGMLRVHATVTRELDGRLRGEHGISLDAYGVLITLVTQTGEPLTLSDLAARRNLSPSGITRTVDRLAASGLVQRLPNPADGRSAFVTLTDVGLRKLREAQVTHHAVVRRLLFERLGAADIEALGKLWEKAVPGAVSSPVWPLASGWSGENAVEQPA